MRAVDSEYKASRNRILLSNWKTKEGTSTYGLKSVKCLSISAKAYERERQGLVDLTKLFLLYSALNLLIYTKLGAYKCWVQV